MQQIHSVADLRQAINNYRSNNLSVALVPTMGNLHDGHLSLINTAKQHADIVIVSIFVNPLQFGPNEDFNQYPRTLKTDLVALLKYPCDLVYCPEKSALIPDNQETQTSVFVPQVGETMEAEFRGNHLKGVATIVTKLFNLVQPDYAVFGKKDYQQWLMIKKMCADLNMPIKIIGAETVREKDGLAMSSRNQYLDKPQRKIAAELQKTLKSCASKINVSNDIPHSIKDAKDHLESVGFVVDYLEIRQQETLSKNLDHNNCVLLSTSRLGKTRLLDNIEFELNT